MKELAYKPVLANFCEIDGVKDFTSHDFEIDDDENFIYYEKQVGCFTVDKPYLQIDPQKDDRMNMFAKVAIPRQYTDAAEIIERKSGTACSVELAVNELSWDQKEKTLMLDDVTIMGLTLLGKNPETGDDVQPGMENAHIQLEDFSIENNSLTFNSNIINEIADAIVNKISNAKTTERRNDVVENENVNVEFEETDVEETDTKPVKVEEAEVETTEEETPVVETEASEEESVEATDVTPEVVDEFEDNTEIEPISETFDDTVSDSDDVDDPAEDLDEETGSDDDLVTDDGVLNNGQQAKRFSINGKNFEVSLSEIQYSLYELVNNTYSESDNDYYSVEVYEGSKTVVMSGLFSGRSYKQGYKVRNEVYSLVGDRVSVKPVFVTADEEAELDRMRSNYSSISEKLQKYESEPEKMNILNSSDYASIAEQTDFVELKKQENHFDMSVDELKTKADEMLLQYAKSGKLNFAAIEKSEEPKKDFFAFSKVEQNTSFLDGLLRQRK